jgi:cell wall-associated NlpC family hydrolase
MSQDCQRHRLQQAPTVLTLALLALLTLLASGCAPFRPDAPSEPAASEPSSASQQGVGAVIVQQALAQVGAPYRYGGADPARGFDCSGLVSYAHSRAGISVPRTAAAQFAAARKVDPGALRAGDLVFFRLVPGSRAVTHVGIYTGQRRFVHAPQTGRNVGEASLDDPYYRERFAGAGRLFADEPGAGPRLTTSPR